MKVWRSPSWDGVPMLTGAPDPSGPVLLAEAGERVEGLRLLN